MNSDTTTEHLRYPPIAVEYGGDWNESYDLHGIIGFVMGGRSRTWYMHPDTETRVTNRAEHYDGRS
jgi:hypothetical protein